MRNHELRKLETDGFVTSDQPSRRPASQLIRNTTDKPTATKKSAVLADDDEMDISYKRLLVKTGICAAIAIAILVISSLETPSANNITQTISQTVNHEFDIDEDIGRLKFVQSLDDEVQSVFSARPDASMVYPADGEVVTRFGQGGSVGVRMTAQTESILCIAKGTVTAVGTINDAGYVTIMLDSGETVAFYNVVPEVKVNDIVMPGQSLGTLSGKYLYFEMRQGEEYIDPLEYIKQRAVMAVQ